jgi:hypothetical protein
MTNPEAHEDSSMPGPSEEPGHKHSSSGLEPQRNRSEKREEAPEMDSGKSGRERESSTSAAERIRLPDLEPHLPDLDPDLLERYQRFSLDERERSLALREREQRRELDLRRREYELELALREAASPEVVEQQLVVVSEKARGRQVHSYVLLGILMVVAAASVYAGLLVDNTIFWAIAGTVFFMSCAGIIAFAATGLGAFAQMIELIRLQFHSGGLSARQAIRGAPRSLAALAEDPAGRADELDVAPILDE